MECITRKFSNLSYILTSLNVIYYNKAHSQTDFKKKVSVQNNKD